jgi:predicted NBD/HSP70 family sugar kinase
MTTTLGVDIGGSSIEVVARNEAAEIVGAHHTRSRMSGGDQVANAAVNAVRELAVVGYSAVGVGVPGHVDSETGEVSLAVNLGIGGEPFDLAAAISAGIGAPVTVENDVRTAALGARESLQLAGRDVQSLAVLSVGTGISAGVIVNGSLVTGSHGMAGEIGHVVVDPNGPVCPCGQRGCLETMAAGPAIGRAWPGGGQLPATALFGAVAAGDVAARKVADRITGHLTTALIWMAATYDPEVFVLAGGVTSAGEVFLEVMRDKIEQRAAASELAARRLRPEQVILADPLDPPGPRGAALLAARNILQERVSPATTRASNQQPLGGTV